MLFVWKDGVGQGLCLCECETCVSFLAGQRLCGVWFFEDCDGKLTLCMYLGCVVQEVPGRDDHVWNGMVCWVHGCMVWVVLCVVRCGVIVVGVSCASWICGLSGRCQV